MGRRSQDEGGRDWSDASISQGSPKASRNPPEAKGWTGGRGQSLPHSLGWSQPCPYLNHGILAPKL